MGNYHDWSEKDFDWNSLNEAGYLIERICAISRLGINWKEKYGTLRIYPNFFTGSLHELQYPGYVYCQYKFLRDQRWYLDIYFWPTVFKYTGMTWLIRKVQELTYTLAFYIAMKKYPNIKEEICVNAE